MWTSEMLFIILGTPLKPHEISWNAPKIPWNSLKHHPWPITSENSWNPLEHPWNDSQTPWNPLECTGNPLKPLKLAVTPSKPYKFSLIGLLIVTAVKASTVLNMTTTGSIPVFSDTTRNTLRTPCYPLKPLGTAHGTALTIETAISWNVSKTPWDVLKDP